MMGPRRLGVPVLVAAALALTAACGPSPGAPAGKTRLPAPSLSPPELVAHAGGGVRGLIETNSREALAQAAADGFKLIEVDIDRTRDDRLVLIHDWGQTVMTLFGAGPRPRTATEFAGLHMRGGLTQLTLEDAMTWLGRHPEVSLVTDIKVGNVQALRAIAARWPALRPRIVPQIYAFDELDPVRAAGFERIVFTLYHDVGVADGQVEAFAARAGLFAVTMPVARVRSGLAARLAQDGVFVYAHTVNDPTQLASLRERGVQGVYTDWLRPAAAATRRTGSGSS